MRSDTLGDGSHSGSLKHSSNSSESLGDFGGVEVMTNVGLPVVVVAELAELESWSVPLLLVSSDSWVRYPVIVRSDSLALNIGKACASSSSLSDCSMNLDTFWATVSEKSNEIFFL